MSGTLQPAPPDTAPVADPSRPVTARIANASPRSIRNREDAEFARCEAEHTRRLGVSTVRMPPGAGSEAARPWVGADGDVAYEPLRAYSLSLAAFT